MWVGGGRGEEGSSGLRERCEGKERGRKEGRKEKKKGKRREPVSQRNASLLVPTRSFHPFWFSFTHKFNPPPSPDRQPFTLSFTPIFDPLGQAQTQQVALEREGEVSERVGCFCVTEVVEGVLRG